MYDNYSMPDPRFYKLYANKFRDMHSLRTNDIDGAQPKKQTYDRNDFVNKYYDRVVSHNQVRQTNGPKNLNYWSLPQQDVNSSPVRQKGGLSYNASQVNYNKPEDYHLPNNYTIPANNRQAPPQYQQQQQYAGNQGYSNNNSSIRNPMYSDYDYNNRQQQNQYANQGQYQNSPQRTASGKGGNVYVRDSLDALQIQYGANPYQNQSQQYPPQNQNAPQVQEFKQDWLNFYGVDSAPNTQKQGAQNATRQNQSPVKQQDPTIKANAAKFYGEGPSEEDQFEKNLHAFYGADNSLPVKPTQSTLARAHTNMTKKDVKLYNPLIHAPMLHYAKDHSKFEKPKVMDVREQWQFKQNLQKFFDV